MPRYDDDTLKAIQDSSPLEKLSVMKSEMIVPIQTICGYSAILKKIDLEAVTGLPSGFSTWIDSIAKAGTDLLEILEAVTGPIMTQS